MQPIRVALADDDPAVRRALVAVMDMDARFEVVASAATGEALVDAVRETGPHVVLVDVRMPGGGPDVVRAILAAGRGDASGRWVGGSEPVVVAVSAETGADTVAAIVAAGASGYVGKGQLGDRLPDLVARCADGEVVLAVASGADALRQVVSWPTGTAS